MQNGKFGVVDEKTLLASRIYGCATSDDQERKIEAGACLLANFFFFFFFSFWLRAKFLFASSTLPTNFPPSRAAPSRLIISNKRSRRRKRTKSCFTSSCYEFDYFLWSGISRWMSCNFSFFIWNDNLTRTRYLLVEYLITFY